MRHCCSFTLRLFYTFLAVFLLNHPLFPFPTAQAQRNLRTNRIRRPPGDIPDDFRSHLTSRPAQVARGSDDAGILGKTNDIDDSETMWRQEQREEDERKVYIREVVTLVPHSPLPEYVGLPQKIIVVLDEVDTLSGLVVQTSVCYGVIKISGQDLDGQEVSGWLA